MTAARTLAELYAAVDPPDSTDSFPVSILTCALVEFAGVPERDAFGAARRALDSVTGDAVSHESTRRLVKAARLRARVPAP